MKGTVSKIYIFTFALIVIYISMHQR